MAARGSTRRIGKKQSARARGSKRDLNPTFIEPDAKWVRTQWPSLPQDSSTKINLTTAGLDKYVQTHLLPLDLNLLKHAVNLFDGDGIPIENHYVKIDPQTVSTVTGLPASGDSVDMSVERKRANPGGRAKVALEICGSNKAFGSKGIRVDLIKPVELRWAAAVLTSRVFGQQKGEYLNLWHFNLVKMVSLGHRFNWAEFVAGRIKEQLRKISSDGKGCFYLGTVLSGLIYDQVPHLGPPEKGGLDLGGSRGSPSLMKWAVLSPKKERGLLNAVKNEVIECPNGDLDHYNDEKKEGALEINNLDGPSRQNGRLALTCIGNDRPMPLPGIPLIGIERIDVTGQDERVVKQEPMSFRELLQKQVLLSTIGYSVAGMGMNVGGAPDLGNAEKTPCFDVVYNKLESPPNGHFDEPRATIQTCSASGTGTGSPCNQESPKPKSSEVAEQLDSPRSVRKHPLFERQEEMSSKRMKLRKCRPPEALHGVPLQQMTMGENLLLFKSVFNEVEKRLQSVDQDFEWWKSCAQELFKDLNHHFAGLPIKEYDRDEILTEGTKDSVEMQQCRAYIKKAAKIIKEQGTEIQLLKAVNEKTKKLECVNLSLKKDLEKERQYRKSAEEQAVNLENQLVQIKQKLHRVLDD